jgi:hypothetical protein
MTMGLEKEANASRTRRHSSVESSPWYSASVALPLQWAQLNVQRLVSSQAISRGGETFSIVSSS